MYSWESSSFQCREQNRIQRIGAQFAIQAICTYFGPELKEKVPIFWTLLKTSIQFTEEDLQRIYLDDSTPVNFDQATKIMTCLQLIESASITIHPTLIEELLELLPQLNILLRHPLKAVSNTCA